MGVAERMRNILRTDSIESGNREGTQNAGVLSMCALGWMARRIYRMRSRGRIREQKELKEINICFDAHLFKWLIIFKLEN